MPITKTIPETHCGRLSKEDLISSAEALRTKARIWSEWGGRKASEPFVAVAEFLERLAESEQAVERRGG